METVIIASLRPEARKSCQPVCARWPGEHLHFYWKILKTGSRVSNYHFQSSNVTFPKLIRSSFRRRLRGETNPSVVLKYRVALLCGNIIDVLQGLIRRLLLILVRNDRTFPNIGCSKKSSLGVMGHVSQEQRNWLFLPDYFWMQRIGIGRLIASHSLYQGQ